MRARRLDFHQGRVLNYAGTILAALRDVEVSHSCLATVPNGSGTGVDHGLERGPAIEWGHDASIHERPVITVSRAMCHGTN